MGLGPIFRSRWVQIFTRDKNFLNRSSIDSMLKLAVTKQQYNGIL